MPSALTPTAQLLALRDLTRRIDALHEGQVLQIRLWPYSVDPGLKDVPGGAEVSIEHKTVSYKWTSGPKPIKVDDAYRHRLRELARGVHTMLGPEWRLKVVRDGVPIFEGGVQGESESAEPVRTKRKPAKPKRAGRRPAGKPKLKPQRTKRKR